MEGNQLKRGRGQMAELQKVIHGFWEIYGSSFLEDQDIALLRKPVNQDRR